MAKAGGFIGFIAIPGRSLFSLSLLIFASKLRGFPNVPAESARFVKGIADPWQAAVKAVHKFGEDRDLHHLYYSFDVVRSAEARRAGIPPDLDGPY